MRKLASALVGRAQQILNPIFHWWWNCVPSQEFGQRQPCPGVVSLYAGAHGEFSSRRTLPTRRTPHTCCCQCPCPHSRPQLTPSGESQTQGSPARPHAGPPPPFPWVPGNTRFCLFLQVSCFPSLVGSSVIKSHKTSSLGFPVPLPDPQVGESAAGLRTFTSEREFWYNCSQTCGSPTCHSMVMTDSLDRTWSTGEGKGKPLQ